MSDERELLKIGELARRAGVGRGTIQHYLREGLLPRPVKTQRNMAYYDASCVDRIKTIKELQTRRHLPLSVIREILGAAASEGEMAKALLEAQKAALESISPPPSAKNLTPEAAARAFDLHPKVIDTLRSIGLVSLRRVGEEEVFAGADLEVLAAVSELARVGFREELGFRAEDLRIYLDALKRLLGEEVRTFLEAAAREQGAGELPRLARSAVDAATLLVVALRRKLIADLLSTPEAEFLEQLRDTAAQARHGNK